jgi:phosphoribosyl-ATP pyrophosphohydrolase
VIRDLLPLARCRVGGGIRDAATARQWLDDGAVKVILGTAARPEVLRELPRERVIAALDAKDGEVVVEGWVKGTGRGVLERIAELREYVGGFLVTFVEIEGTLTGLDAARVKPVVEAAGPGCRVTAAGGVKSAVEVGELDRVGADAQVGMAIYTGQMHVADAWAACLTSDRADGLWPTVVADESGVALGLAYSNAESLRCAIDERIGVYHSRSRGGLWRKGATSGALQQLIRIDADCDRDAIRMTVRQAPPGFCHLNTRTCWGAATGLTDLRDRLARIAESGGDAGSYTSRLMRDPKLLASKIAEEGGELSAATEPGHIAQEAADVLYFLAVKLQASGVAFADVERVLDRRALKLSRRPGDAKPSVKEGSR